MKLTAIIITRNEERDLPACLESLKGTADEIVVVDNHSTDKTVEVARRYTDKIFQHEWAGFGPQKQYALDRATGDWVINVDADERLTPELAAEIRAALAAGPKVNGFWLRFHVYFLGRRLRFGGTFREYHIRLFRRSAAKYGDQFIHEGITVTEPHGCLKHAVRHESYRNFAEYLEKCRLYTGLIARDKFAQGKRFSAWQHLRLPWEFFARFILKLGFLDGSAGVTYAALSAYYAWLKHVRLLDCERGTES